MIFSIVISIFDGGINYRLRKIVDEIYYLIFNYLLLFTLQMSMLLVWELVRLYSDNSGLDSFKWQKLSILHFIDVIIHINFVQPTHIFTQHSDPHRTVFLSWYRSKLQGPCSTLAWPSQLPPSRTCSPSVLAPLRSVTCWHGCTAHYYDNIGATTVSHLLAWMHCTWLWQYWRHHGQSHAGRDAVHMVITILAPPRSVTCWQGCTAHGYDYIGATIRSVTCWQGCTAHGYDYIGAIIRSVTFWQGCTVHGYDYIGATTVSHMLAGMYCTGYGIKKTSHNTD